MGLTYYGLLFALIFVEFESTKSQAIGRTIPAQFSYIIPEH